MSEGRVLVVDDEPSLRMTLAANLELAGFDVLEASSGEEAIAVLEREHVDLVLSDIRMPGMHGVDLFRRVRESRPSLPVVLMSAFAVEHLVEQAFREGVFTVLTKPFDLDRVIRLLARAIRKPIVLVVDEAAADRGATVAALDRAGVSCAEVANVDDAETLVNAKTVDVCVIDLQTSGGDLADVVRRLDARRREIAIIAVAGIGALDRLGRAAEAGAFECMMKPLPHAALVVAVGRARARSS